MFTLKNRLNMIVNEIMLPLGKFPIIGKSVILKEALEEMSRYKLGIVCIVDENGILLGVFTDGDVRRHLLSFQKPFSAFFIDDTLDHAVHSPLTVGLDDQIERAIDMMGERQVWDLPVIDKNGRLVGLLHLHPIVKSLMNR
jgi:arabinose-5-phosphate isomerase